MVLALLSGCAAPVFKDAPAIVATPVDIASEPERYHGADVIWGGKIIDVRNLTDTTEVEVVAYPLDASQRPDQNAPTSGRFIVAIPGYVEPFDFPTGRFVTLRGRVDGTRVTRVDEHEVAFPLVADANVHVWPANFPYEQSRVHFSFGLGVGIH
ncbi:MAG TPA: Slp family lipoprotein [Rhodanobacteraceae bacterium]|jgi:outer membrane lipoprotein|nr:Slp family lipoprotein [Rhodanobacteraceae bacterium]